MPELIAGLALIILWLYGFPGRFLLVLIDKFAGKHKSEGVLKVVAAIHFVYGVILIIWTTIVIWEQL